jgi:hypothetical protein
MLKFFLESRPFHALSNSEIYVAVSLILCTAKRIQLLTETALAFNSIFSIKFSTCRKTKCTIRKNIKFWSISSIRFTVISYLYMTFAFEGIGNTYEPGRK